MFRVRLNRFDNSNAHDLCKFRKGSVDMLTSIYHLFPSTIHPMVVHFTIAINYLCALAGLLGLFLRKTDFWGKAFFYLLILSILATIGAGVAGVISESYISHIPGAVQPIFHDHKKYGELTGVFLVLAFLTQTYLLWRSKLHKVYVAAFILCVVSTVFVTLAGHLGGTMVYHYGFGVH